MDTPALVVAADTTASAPVLERLRAIPGLRQLLLLLGLAAAIAAGLSLFMWSQKPGNQPLYAGLPEADVAAMADALSAAAIPHEIDPASGALTVPADRVREARLKLAGMGLPKSGSTGFEMLQGEQGFGVSQSVESARMQHALETELVRTISALQPVKTARVHLAIPKPSAFARAGGTPSASVLVELYPGRVLDRQQVASIVHMVASSVAELSPSAVTVIDQAGHLLTDENADSPAGLSSSQFEHIQRVEDATRRRVEDILTPLVGPGHVQTQVTADLDFTVQELTEEQYHPDAAAIRSEQTSEDITQGGNKAQGIPGATSNRPPQPGASAPAIAPTPAASTAGNAGANPSPGAGATPVAAATATESPVSQSRSSTRNFEINKTTSYRKPVPGRIQRLSVAVLVDYLPRADAKGVLVPTALTPAELARVEALVKDAIGFNAERGDKVTVQNAAFVTPAPEAVAPLPLLERPEIQSLARQGVAALILLVLIFAVVRPLLRSLFPPPPAPPKTVADARLPALAAPDFAATDAAHAQATTGQMALEGALATALAAPAGPSLYEQKLVQAREAVKADPKRVAQVMKTWIAQE